MGLLTRDRYPYFEERNPSHGLDPLVVFDFTSSIKKNVVPNCFRIFDVLGFFGTVHDKLEKRKLKMIENAEKNEDEVVRLAGFDFENENRRFLDDVLNLAEFVNIQTTLDEV